MKCDVLNGKSVYVTNFEDMEAEISCQTKLMEVRKVRYMRLI